MKKKTIILILAIIALVLLLFSQKKEADGVECRAAGGTCYENPCSSRLDCNEITSDCGPILYCCVGSCGWTDTWSQFKDTVKRYMGGNIRTLNDFVNQANIWLG